MNKAQESVDAKRKRRENWKRYMTPKNSETLETMNDKPEPIITLHFILYLV
jgi:hypothetical protein